MVDNGISSPLTIKASGTHDNTFNIAIYSWAGTLSLREKGTSLYLNLRSHVY